MEMKVFVDIEIMTKISKEFMATLEISVISKRSKVRKKFYKSDYIKTADTMEEAVDNFCKFLLSEYFILTKKNSDKQIFYVIKCSQKIYNMMKGNGWLDQLYANLGNPEQFHYENMEEN